MVFLSFPNKHVWHSSVALKENWCARLRYLSVVLKVDVMWSISNHTVFRIGLRSEPATKNGKTLWKLAAKFKMLTCVSWSRVFQCEKKEGNCQQQSINKTKTSISTKSSSTIALSLSFLLVYPQRARLQYRNRTREFLFFLLPYYIHIQNE